MSEQLRARLESLERRVSELEGRKIDNQLGEPIDISAYVNAFTRYRTPGDNLAERIRTLPKRVVYRHTGNTDEELELLDFYRKAAVEPDNWFTVATLGHPYVAELDGVAVMPDVNMDEGIELSYNQARFEYLKWVRQQLVDAHRQDGPSYHG